MIEFVIVSRHQAAVEFIRGEIRLHFAAWVDADDVPVFSGNVTVADVKGKVVFGNLPLSLAAEARMVFAVEFSGPPPRGREYGPEEMRAAGAFLRPYQVRSATYLTDPPLADRLRRGWENGVRAREAEERCLELEKRLRAAEARIRGLKAELQEAYKRRPASALDALARADRLRAEDARRDAEDRVWREVQEESRLGGRDRDR